MTERLSASEATTSRGTFLSIYPSIILPMFLAVMDQTIISAALPEIAASLLWKTSNFSPRTSRRWP